MKIKDVKARMSLINLENVEVLSVEEKTIEKLKKKLINVNIKDAEGSEGVFTMWENKFYDFDIFQVGEHYHISSCYTKDAFNGVVQIILGKEGRIVQL